LQVAGAMHNANQLIATSHTEILKGCCIAACLRTLRCLSSAENSAKPKLPFREVDEKIWLVSFLDFDLGYFDEVEGRVEPRPNPFVAKVLTMPPV
jgi:hypothetical protein